MRTAITIVKAYQVPVEIGERSLAAYIELAKLWELAKKLTSADAGEVQCIRVAKHRLLESIDNLLEMRTTVGLVAVPDGSPTIEIPRRSEAEYQEERERDIADQLVEQGDKELAILHAFMSFEGGKRLIEADLVELFDEAALHCSDGQGAVLRLYTMGWVALGGLVKRDSIKDYEIFSPRLAAIPGPKGQSYTTARLTKVGRDVLDHLLENAEGEDVEDE